MDGFRQKLLRLWLFGVVICTLALLPVSVTGQSESPGDPLMEKIVKELAARNAKQAAELLGFSGTRTYRVEYRGILGNRDAEMVVGIRYVAPGQKEFVIRSRAGSKFIFNHVFQPLLENEKQAGSEANRRNLELSVKNYTFTLSGVERTGVGRNYVLQVEPRQECPLCYRGKIWVDADDFAVQRIEGEPAQNPSFWIQRTEIVQQYTKIGNFWLPAENRSKSWIRLGGSAILSIHYTDYQITSSFQSPAPATANGEQSGPASSGP